MFGKFIQIKKVQNDSGKITALFYVCPHCEGKIMPNPERHSHPKINLVNYIALFILAAPALIVPYFGFNAAIVFDVVVLIIFVPYGIYIYAKHYNGQPRYVPYRDIGITTKST